MIKASTTQMKVSLMDDEEPVVMPLDAPEMS